MASGYGLTINPNGQQIYLTTPVHNLTLSEHNFLFQDKEEFHRIRPLLQNLHCKRQGQENNFHYILSRGKLNSLRLPEAEP